VNVTVEAVYALPDKQVVTTRVVPAGTTVGGLLALLNNEPPFASLDLSSLAVGIFGVVVERSRVLADGDRVEIYRPLSADPKTQRRRRARRDARGK